MNKLVYIALFSITLFSCQPKQKDYIQLEGAVFGTFYHVKYQPVKTINLSDGINKELSKVNGALSSYVDTSTIRRFNESTQGIVVDSMMKYVIEDGLQVFKNTDGAFDMTVGALVNAWGFGFKKRDIVTDEQINLLLSHVGMQNVQLKGDSLLKTDAAITLDAAAIAKGYGVDVVADYLESEGIQNYMVEIGGEIRVKGVNNKGLDWHVGIDKPIDDVSAKNTQIEAVIAITGMGMATSGNYRNFYMKDGKKYAHTISPYNGYPVLHSILSASILAPKCMTADAYATACMVMGVDKSMKVIESLPDVEGYFIYSDEDGNMKVKYTSGFEKYIIP